MSILDLIVVFLAVFILWRYSRSRKKFIDWIGKAVSEKYIAKVYIIIFILCYTLVKLILKIDWSFLNYKIF